MGYLTFFARGPTRRGSCYLENSAHDYVRLFIDMGVHFFSPPPFLGGGSGGRDTAGGNERVNSRYNFERNRLRGSIFALE